jgi:hypothetical protein
MRASTFALTAIVGEGSLPFLKKFKYFDEEYSYAGKRYRATVKSENVLGHESATLGNPTSLPSSRASKNGSAGRTLDRPETLLLEQIEFRPKQKLGKSAKAKAKAMGKARGRGRVNPAPGVSSGRLGADTSASGPPLRPPSLPVSSNL